MKIENVAQMPPKTSLPDELLQKIKSMKVNEILKITTELKIQTEQKKFYFRLHSALDTKNHKGNYQISKRKELFFIKRLK